MARQTTKDLADPSIQLVDVDNTYLLEILFLGEVRRLHLVTTT